MLSGATIPSANVRNDLETVVEAHDLSAGARNRLVQIVTGTVRGNRDKPLFGLVKAIQTHTPQVGGEAQLFALLANASDKCKQPAISRFSLALLDFLATMDDYRYLAEIQRAVADASLAQDKRELAAAAGMIASCLHNYRVRNLPYENRRQAFLTIRKFFRGSGVNVRLPQDGDAILFWAEVSSPESWTTYAATFTALIDFVEAVSDVASGKEASLEEMSEQGFEPAEGVFDTVGSEEPDFLDAVESLAIANLKLFKGPDIEELKRLAAALPGLQRWRRAGSALLCFGPVQNVLVQKKRQSFLVDSPTIQAFLAKSRRYDEVVSILKSIELTCHDFGAFYQKFIVENTETSAPSSNIDANTERRIAGLMRRKSFAEVGPEALREKVSEIFPDVAVVAMFLSRILGQMENWQETARKDAFVKDRAVFGETFSRLYCTEGS